MKIIKQEQLNVVLETLFKYNVGVAEFNSIQKMFNELPESPVTNQEVAEKNESKE